MARGWAGVLHLVSEPTLAVTQACAGQGRGHVGHGSALRCADMWNMCRHWTHGRVPRGEVPGLGLTDEGVGLLRGCVCEILAQGSIGLIGYAYQQGIPCFPEAHLQRTPRLSVLGPEQFEDG